MLDHGTDRSRVLGIDMIGQMVREVPVRADVWAAVALEDQEIMLVWLGLSRWPSVRHDRRHRAELALDTDAAAVHAMLHEHGLIGNTWSAGLNGPF